MATNLEPKSLSYIAEGDLSTHKNKAVKFGSDRTKVVLCGAGERGIGVLQNAPALGETAEVIVSGGAKIKVASNVTAGNSCAVGANGVGVNAGAAAWSIGQFMDSGASGDVVSIVIDRHNSPA